MTRRPNLSATKPNTNVPINRPKNVEATNSDGPENSPTVIPVSIPAFTRPGMM
jgi:hypothetical protein